MVMMILMTMTMINSKVIIIIITTWAAPSSFEAHLISFSSFLLIVEIGSHSGHSVLGAFGEQP